MLKDTGYYLENGILNYYVLNYNKKEAELVSRNVGKLAIIYDTNQEVLLKHGKSEYVRANYEDYTSKMTKAGNADLVDGVIFLELDYHKDIDLLEDLNQSINCTGRKPRFLKEIDL